MAKKSDTDIKSLPPHGTPGKDPDIKYFLRRHSAKYFAPKIPERDERGKPTGALLSKFDVDMESLDPQTRVQYEIAALKFTTPQMSSTSIDLSANDDTRSCITLLSRLAKGEEVSPPQE